MWQDHLPFGGLQTDKHRKKTAKTFPKRVKERRRKKSAKISKSR